MTQAPRSSETSHADGVGDDAVESCLWLLASGSGSFFSRPRQSHHRSQNPEARSRVEAGTMQHTSSPLLLLLAPGFWLLLLPSRQFASQKAESRIQKSEAGTMQHTSEALLLLAPGSFFSPSRNSHHVIARSIRTTRRAMRIRAQCPVGASQNRSVLPSRFHRPGEIIIHSRCLLSIARQCVGRGSFRQEPPRPDRRSPGSLLPACTSLTETPIR